MDKSLKEDEDKQNREGEEEDKGEVNEKVCQSNMLNGKRN